MPPGSTRGSDGEDEAAIAAELLNSGNSCVSLARTQSCRDSVQGEHTVFPQAERADHATRNIADPNRRALEYYRWSEEQAQQARAEADRARDHYELLSRSSRSREHSQANRGGAEDDVSAP